MYIDINPHPLAGYSRKMDRKVRFSRAAGEKDAQAFAYFSKFLQCRPSCSSRASASFGPQVPDA